ncbi:MAG: NUDIX hydrolase [Parvularculaceae bacterium]
MNSKIIAKYDDLTTIRLSQVSQTRISPGVGDEYVLVLLRHQGIIRDTYYLNLRPKVEIDDVYANKFGLFGGKVERTDDRQAKENEETAAEREIFEETGLEIGQDAYWLADVFGYNNARKRTKGTLFLKVLRKSPYRDIVRYLEEENPRLEKAGRNPIGKVVCIHRYRFGFVLFLRWWRLTPQAAFALRDVLERDPTLR